MAKILCLETATEVCSVCIHEDGVLLAMEESKEAFEHSKMITVFIQECLRKASLKITELDAVAVSSGPGSYTGLRVGTSTAKGLCFGLDIPLITVPGLLALTSGYLSEHTADAYEYIVPMIDARRKEVYAAIFDAKSNLVKDTFSYILDKDPLPEALLSKKTMIIGNGAEKASSILKAENLHYTPRISSSSDLIPDSQIFYQNSRFEDLISFAPVYYKAPNITKPKNKAL